jgi:mannitol-specific phosphotransferase system IIBC component
MATIQGIDVKKVTIACEAGMGSSVLLTAQLRKRLSNYGVTVDHSPVNQIPDDTDVVMCHEGLSARARQKATGVPVLTFKTYLGDPAFDRLEEAIRNDQPIDG